MNEEKVMPGEREKQEIDERFREIYRYAKSVHPLPDKYINNTEIRTHGNLADTFARLRRKEIDKEAFDVIVRQIIKKQLKPNKKDTSFFPRLLPV